MRSICCRTDSAFDPAGCPTSANSFMSAFS
jgi:hypothetical protein